MKVEIWHKRQETEAVRYIKGQTLDLFSVSDENTCELAFLHTSNGSLPRLQDQTGLVPETGDIFILIDDDPKVPHRFYSLTTTSDCCDAPEFTAVTFDFDFRGEYGNH